MAEAAGARAADPGAAEDSAAAVVDSAALAEAAVSPVVEEDRHGNCYSIDPRKTAGSRKP